MRKILLCCLILIGLLAACAPAKPPVPETGITIHCAFIGYGDYEKLYENLDQFEQETGYKVKIVYQDNLFELDKKLKRDFAAGTVNYDVISNHSSFFTQYTEYLEPLDSYFPDLSDVLPRLLNSGRHNGALYLMPRHADISSIIYRTDLFDDKTNQQQYYETYHKPLAPPETWEDYLNISLFFGKKSGLYGTAMAGKEEALTGRFHEILVANGGSFIQNGQAAFNSPAGIKSAQLLKNLYQSGCMPPDTLNYLWDDVSKAFAQGQVAMYLDWYNCYSFLQNPKDSKVRGKFDLARLPMGDGNIHSGWTGIHGFAITKASTQKEAAAKLIQFLTSKESSLLEAQIGYLPVRASSWQTLLQQAEHAKDPLEKKRLELALLQFSEDSFSPPLIPEWLPASDILYPILQKIMTGEMGVTEGLDLAKRQVDEVLKG